MNRTIGTMLSLVFRIIPTKLFAFVIIDALKPTVMYRGALSVAL